MSKQIVGRTTEDVKRLPAWAQRQIKNLTSEVERLQSMLAKMPPDQTNVILVDHLDEHGLPPDSRVRFRIEQRTIEVSVCKDRKSFEVRSNDGSLVVLPAVSNVIYIRVDR